MKFAILFLMATTASATTASDRFAIECIGKAQFIDNLSGHVSKRDYSLPKQIYVFDEVAKRVHIAAIPRQEFEEVCFRGGYIDSTNFSPGLIQVVSETSDRRCDFAVNRVSGDAEYFSHDDFQGGQYSEMKWLMTCKKTKIPSFKSVRKRF